MPKPVNKKAEIQQRRTVVMANLLAGLNYRDMADGLGVSIGTIASDVKVIFDNWRLENLDLAEQARELDLRRIDTAINAIWPKVRSGELLAIDRMERLLRRRADMWGYDLARLRVDLEDHTKPAERMSTAELLERAKKLEAMAAALLVSGDDEGLGE